jgi:BlaI family transcriptional regulator, penicillinase repressor
MLMPRKSQPSDLARRERQIMDVIHRLGEASVGDVLAALPDPPSYSAVRTMIRLLEAKRWLRHRQDGKRYVYRATQSHEVASRSALRKVLDVFFAGSASNAVAAILDLSGDRLSAEDLDRMTKLIQEARNEGK